MWMNIKWEEHVSSSSRDQGGYGGMSRGRRSRTRALFQRQIVDPDNWEMTVWNGMMSPDMQFYFWEVLSNILLLVNIQWSSKVEARHNHFLFLQNIFDVFWIDVLCKMMSSKSSRWPWRRRRYRRRRQGPGWPPWTLCQCRDLIP